MTNTVVPSPIVHELLNQNNYEEWSLRVETYLLAKGLWEVVEATTEPPKREDGEVEFQAWRKGNAEALHSIQVSCGADTFSYIRGTRRAKIAWDILAVKLKPAEASQAIGTGPENDAKEELHREGDEDNHFNQTILDFVDNDEWGAAMEFLIQHPKAVTARIREGGTILHWAVYLKKVDIAKELVHLMTPDDLEIQDYVGHTALHRVIIDIPEGVQLAKCMVEKNKKLLSIVLPPEETSPLLTGKITPLIRAHDLIEGEKMAQYLYSVTPHETLNDSECAMLIIQGLTLQIFDIAWDLIQRRPELAIAKDFFERTPLNALAGMSSAFLSGSPLNLREKLIYCGIQIKPMPTIEEPIPTTDDDVCINVQKPEDGDQSKKRQRHLICSDTSLQRGLVEKAFDLLGFNHIYQMKLAHVRILEFLPRMCKVTKNKAINELQGLEIAMFLAIKRGHVEYIAHLCSAKSDLQYIMNEEGMNIFQFAAKCRQHKVFNLFYELYGENLLRSHVSRKDKLGNNMLHVVGTISSVAQTNHIQGPALQMQREMQWFKEVERIARAIDLEEINHTDKMTPRELFTKGHKELVKEAVKAMKDTATSCTVFGTLVATMMFAAVFTVPGGNNQDTGFPIFLSKENFICFIVSDAISLFSSISSIMMFLGIFTSRYSEDDFLNDLPTKMMFGFCTLFISIFTMLTAFSLTLYIMLPGKSFMPFLILGLEIVPVTFFIWMQYPSLVQIFNSTYGPGVFDRKIKYWPRVNVIINDAY